MAYQQLASTSGWGSLAASYTVKEAGYAYMYVSNEQSVLTDVYFDDVTMSYTPSAVLQYNEYYPFGLQAANSWTRATAMANNFLANGGTEINTTTKVYDLDFRNYDPALGRMNQVDAMADKYGSFTPYHFALNNPVTLNDPTGADPPFGDIAYGIYDPGPDNDAIAPRGGGSIIGFAITTLYETEIGIKNENGNYIDGYSTFTYSFETVNVYYDNAGQGSPIVFVSFDGAPQGFDKAAYMKALTSGLIANGFNKSITVRQSSQSSKWSAWWNNSPNVTISLTSWRPGMATDAGGYTSGYGSPGNPLSSIVYWGLSDTSVMFQADISDYVNATLHEMGHGVFGFPDTQGVSSSLMDYDYVYTPGQTFNSQQVQTISNSIWGNH